MTVTCQRLHTHEETRVLPSMSDDAGWTADTVHRIATHVDTPAHHLAHPRPVHGCPWCPPADGVARDPRAETTWRENAERRPSWSSQAEVAA